MTSVSRTTSALRASFAFRPDSPSTSASKSAIPSPHPVSSTVERDTTHLTRHTIYDKVIAYVKRDGQARLALPEANHMQALLCIARDPDVRTRDIAAMVGITERATQRIVGDLAEAGFIMIERVSDAATDTSSTAR